MRTRPSFLPTRRALVALTGIVALAGGLVAAGSFAQGDDREVGGVPPTPRSQALAAVGPDVVVLAFTDIGNYGSSGGFAGYAIGTRSCNRGDAPLNWCDGEFGTCAPGAGVEDHPVIAQNLYRLKDGRFQQIGMSWLKHGFESTNSTTAGCNGASGQTCTQPPFGLTQLGVGCTDPYVASLNSSRPLGKRSDVDATNGDFPYPYASPGGPYTVYDQRIKVATTDLDAAQNPGALYFAEAQYIAGDDAGKGNGLNNASYRRVTVGASPNYSLTMTGSFFEQQAAIAAWPAQDSTVTLINVDLPGSPAERYQVARKVTNPSNGLWHYEYAVRNHNSNRSARAFGVEFPVPTTVTGVGFKDVDYHSGESIATTDWSVSTTSTGVSWFTDTFATDPNANALRFGTLYNFWFDADQPPSGGAGNVMHTIGLFKAGTPDSISFDGFNALFSNGFEGGTTSAWSGAS